MFVLSGLKNFGLDFGFFIIISISVAIVSVSLRKFKCVY